MSNAVRVCVDGFKGVCNVRLELIRRATGYCGDAMNRVIMLMNYCRTVSVRRSRLG